MWRNLCEISCSQFPWKLKDENQRRISPNFALGNYGPNFRVIKRFAQLQLQELMVFKLNM